MYLYIKAFPKSSFGTLRRGSSKGFKSHQKEGYNLLNHSI
ncbi:hypothetical protein HMPREF3185_01946 [Porphyromonas somerae]|uniref:Uncharacterized protein n=1 Tax=Porphyromonas somerae TaxID=322095 RepID=A0A134B0Q6_9PORP|nr:hypothetical protein HMPREF3184_01946 [Porphyromonadaceae bacterium KA00676]KXB73525.1 hypothetical protein HMPREF3185_01946 [Porphyromonas somerae]